jgi:hypothetical protein
METTSEPTMPTREGAQMDEQQAGGVKVSVDDIAESLAVLGAYAWSASPARTVLGFLLALEALAVRYVERHPDARADVLASLQQVVANVAAATTDPSEVRH